MDAREITDKGSLNQKAVLPHRAALVDELYAASPSAARADRPSAGRSGRATPLMPTHTIDVDAARRLRRARAPGTHRRADRRRRAGRRVLQGRRRARRRVAGRVLPLAQDGVRHLHRGRDADRHAAPVQRRGPRVRREEPRHRAAVRQHQPDARRRGRPRSEAARRHRRRFAA